MGILQRIFHNWLIKGRWILMLSLVLSMALAAVTFFQKQPKKYEAHIYGCTTLLNFQSMFDYYGPILTGMKTGRKDIAAKCLELKESHLRSIQEEAKVIVGKAVGE